MPVHRAAKSRQAALQRVARPGHVRNAPRARRAESLTEQAYRVIEEQIVTLRLKPGDVLSEQFLSVSTKFGRTPIREALQQLARGMDQAAKQNDDIAFMRLDRELNALVIAAVHNDYAARSMKLLQGLSRRFWYMHYREAADLPLCARLHANQARAIAKGDADAAGRASDKLMDYVESFTRATVLA